MQTVRVVPGAFRLPGVTQLTLGAFDGPGGEQLAAALARVFVQQGCFALRDPSAGAVAAVAGPATRGPSTSWQPDGPPAAAKAFGGPEPSAGPFPPGAQAVLSARTVRHELEDEAGGGAGGPADGEVRRRTLHLQVVLQAVDLFSGNLLDVRTFAVRSACAGQVDGGDGRPGPPPDAPGADAREVAGACSAAYDELAARVGAAVALHQEPVDVAFFHLSGDAASTRALEAVRRGDWPLAAALCGAMTASLDARADADDAVRAMAHYNLGVAWAFGGALARGLYELGWSQVLADTPAARIELARVRGWLREADAGSASIGPPPG